VEAVAQANAEAIEALPAAGIAIVPAKEATLDPWLARVDVEVRRFDAQAVVLHDGVWRFPLASGVVELELPFDQRHLAGNVLAALTAYEALGLPLDTVADAAARIELSPWRGQVATLPGGGLVVNDAYNANPVSMRAALLDLVERAGDRRRVAVLGEMAELGPESGRYHADIGWLLRELGIELVVGVGAGAERYAVDDLDSWHHATDMNGAVALLGDALRPGDAVLVKASRAVGLEGIPARIQNLCEAWSAS
jgi:UDP-N-acetylmuramoyl-tripeptide--D-alanyl-D-alanine ligase